jgi:hypothetical protein
VVAAGLKILSQYSSGEDEESNKTSANIVGDPAKIRTRNLRSITIALSFSVETSVNGRIGENNEKPQTPLPGHMPRFELGMYRLRSRSATNSAEILCWLPSYSYITEVNLPQLQAMICIPPVRLWLYSPLLDLRRFFSSLILYIGSVRLLRRGISPSQGRYLHTEQHTQTFMPLVGFEPTILVFEPTKTVKALDRTVTVIGIYTTYSLFFVRG